MTIIEQIRPLVEAGFAIHWLREQSKAPVESAWSTLPRKTMSQLEAEYQAGYNVGVRLGPKSDRNAEKPVSLNPLDLERALKGLLDIPDPEATKPKGKDKPKRKKAPLTPDKE